VRAAAVANCCEITEETSDSKWLRSGLLVPMSHSSEASMTEANRLSISAISPTILRIFAWVIKAPPWGTYEKLHIHVTFAPDLHEVVRVYMLLQFYWRGQWLALKM
jgi:hypothetical protein